jgi:hypothetical protein
MYVIKKNRLDNAAAIPLSADHDWVSSLPGKDVAGLAHTAGEAENFLPDHFKGSK